MKARAVEWLSCDHAVCAMRIDLASYGPQPGVYRDLERLLGVHTPRAASVGSPSSGPGPAVQDGVCDLLSRELGGYAADAVMLARACEVVFGGEARAAPGGEDGAVPGILLFTGMEEFACTRCGQCCLTLDFHGECTAADVAAWERAGRDDILAWVRREPGPYGESRRIWVRPGTELYAESCPWLWRVPGDTAFYCAINDVKPEVCRSYPGLRKHALLTGCRGFSAAP